MSIVPLSSTQSVPTSTLHLAADAGVEGDTAGCKGDVRFASSFLVEQPSHCRGGLPIQRVSGHPLLDWQWRALNLKNVYDTVGDDV